MNPKLEENSVCVVWHEAVQKRNAENEASAFVKLIENFPDVEQFWADNCTVQTKKWTIFIAFTLLVTYHCH